MFIDHETDIQYTDTGCFAMKDRKTLVERFDQGPSREFGRVTTGAGQ